MVMLDPALDYRVAAPALVSRHRLAVLKHLCGTQRAPRGSLNVDVVIASATDNMAIGENKTVWCKHEARTCASLLPPITFVNRNTDDRRTCVGNGVNHRL